MYKSHAVVQCSLSKNLLLSLRLKATERAVHKDVELPPVPGFLSNDDPIGEGKLF